MTTNPPMARRGGYGHRLCVQSAGEPQDRGRRAANAGAMIDAAIFALIVGAIATPVSWWGLNRLS